VAATGVTAAAAGVEAGSGLHRPATLPDRNPAAADEAPRPALRSVATAPAVPVVSLEHNAWVDEFEADFGQEKDVSLTFE
jgi:hypothetical protein